MGRHADTRRLHRVHALQRERQSVRVLHHARRVHLERGSGHQVRGEGKRGDVTRYEICSCGE